MNLAFADREQYVGDPDFVDVPINEMLAEEYLVKRRSLIDPDMAWPGTPPAGDPRNGKATIDGAPQSPREAAVPVGTAGVSGGGTAYFAVIDRDGNIFSCTPSEGTKNGGPIIPGTGLAFSLRGSQSKLTEGHPASVAGGKRPRLTPAPALVLRDGEPVMALGAHGGDHIPQGTLQLLLNVLAAATLKRPWRNPASTAITSPVPTGRQNMSPGCCGWKAVFPMKWPRNYGGRATR